MAQTIDKNTECPKCQGPLYLSIIAPHIPVTNKVTVGCSVCGSLYYAGDDILNATLEIRKYTKILTTLGLTNQAKIFLSALQNKQTTIPLNNSRYILREGMRLTCINKLEIPQQYIFQPGEKYYVKDITNEEQIGLGELYLSGQNHYIDYDDVYTHFSSFEGTTKEDKPSYTMMAAYEANKTAMSCVNCGKKTFEKPIFTGTVQYCSCIDSLPKE
jgi:hypothetical protein